MSRAAAPQPDGAAPGAGSASEIELFQGVREGNDQARNEALARHAGLVQHVVRRFPGHADREDLVQAGMLGLLQAIDRFDPDRGVQFSSYAVPLILGEVRRCFHAQRGGAHIGRTSARLAQRARRTAEQLSQENGRQPSVRELATALEVDAGDLAQLLDAGQPAASLEAAVEEGDWEPTLATASFEDAWVDREAVRHLLAILPERERRLIALRFWAGLSQAETGRRLGVSQVQVSRLERRILARLRVQARNESAR